ncbi:MAG: DUF998 domain-containing protein [Candidatus Hermodarchaeota archaeon]|nr:DUF998 domain-containing protein [Candidatus Hermodarchaeota archaeon]
MTSKSTESQEAFPESFLFSSRLGAICGILGPLIGFASIAIAIGLSPTWFNWWINALSDLGHPAMLGGLNGTPGLNPAAPYFNGGLILTGIVTIIFCTHLLMFFYLRKNIIGMIGTFLFMISMAFLALVGVYHEALLFPHAIAALGFFFTLFICSIILGIAFVRNPSTRIEGIIALIMGVIITITLFVGFSNLVPWTGAAIPEMIMAIAGFIWIIPVCIRMYRYGYEM